MKVRVRWNMPIGRQDVIKEKIVEVEKYEETGDVYLHFFPNNLSCPLRLHQRKHRIRLRTI